MDYSFTIKLQVQRPASRGRASTGTRTPTGRSPPPTTTVPRTLYALWDGAVERSRARLDAALADGGLDQLGHVLTTKAGTPACAGSSAT